MTVIQTFADGGKLVRVGFSTLYIPPGSSTPQAVPPEVRPQIVVQNDSGPVKQTGESEEQKLNPWLIYAAAGVIIFFMLKK